MAENQSIVRLLLVTDSLNQAEDWANAVRRKGHTIRATREETLEGVEHEISQHKWDLLLIVDGLEEAKIDDVIHYLAQTGKDIPCLVVTDEADAEQGALIYKKDVKAVVLSGDMVRLVFAVGREMISLQTRRKLRQLEVALHESEKREQLLLENSEKAIAYIHEGMHVFANKSYIALFGYEEMEELEVLPLLDMVVAAKQANLKIQFREFSETAEDEALTLDLQCVRADAAEFTSQLTLRHAQFEDEVCIQVTWEPQQNVISEKAILEDAPPTPQETEVDDTKPLGRKQFITALDSAVSTAYSGEGDSAVLYLALDDFDGLKSQVGLGGMDTILTSLAQILVSGAAENEVLGRVSERAFMILIQNEHDVEVDMRAAALQELVSAYVPVVDGKKVNLLCSVGVCRLGESTSSVKSVLTIVDKAWTEASQAGGNRVNRYQVAPSSEAQDEKLKRQIENILKENAFKLLYQPIVGLHGEQHVIYEVSLQFTNESGELKEPKAFLPMGKDVSLKLDIDKWMFKRALDVLASDTTVDKTIFFVHLSEQMMTTTEEMTWLYETLAKYKIEGSQIVFEIEESFAMEQLDKVQFFIKLLKKLGCRFSLQGFGSGLDFSQGLNSLDVDFFKINGTFIESMVTDKENQEAVKTIAAMIKETGKVSIAERVTDAQSLAMLWGYGVDYAQGQYMQTPAEEMTYDFDGDGA